MYARSNDHRRLPAVRRRAATALIALVALALPGTAMARTDVERMHFQDEWSDPYYSEVCGTAVNTKLDLHLNHHGFDDDPLRHRHEEQGTREWSSEHGTVIMRWRHAGVHEVAEVLEEVEPGIFLVRARVEGNGMLRLETPGGHTLARDAGKVTFDDLALWDRANDALIGPFESTVARVAGPHPLLDGATFDETVCAQLAP